MSAARRSSRRTRQTETVGADHWVAWACALAIALEEHDTEGEQVARRELARRGVAIVIDPALASAASAGVR